MRKVREILRLRWSEQLSLRDVATALAMPHATVALYEKRALEAGLTWPLPDLDDDALEAVLFVPTLEKVTREAPDFAYLQRELRHKGVTLQLLFDEYRESHPDGYAYSQFCLLFRQWRRHLDVVMRQDHKAGEKLFVDFPGLTIPIYDEVTLAVSFRAELFVAVLGASNYFFAEALRSQELEHWVRAHAHCFEFLGGVPAIVVCDNLKSGVTKASRYEPDLNATFQEMAAHYGTAIIPARPYKPRDKAKVEVGVLIVERWIMARLRKERFTSLADLNEAISSLVELANLKPFKKLESSTSPRYDPCPTPLTSSPRGDEPRSTLTTTSRSSATTTPCPTNWRARSSRCVSPVRSSRSSSRTGAWRRICAVTTRDATRPRPLTCPLRIGVTSSGRPGAS
jgi:transposase